MANRIASLVPLDGDPGDAAMQQQLWRKAWRLSSLGNRAESWLERTGFDRAPWLAIALAAGIAGWFVLPGPRWWAASIALGVLVVGLALIGWRHREGRQQLQRAIVAVVLLAMLGMTLIWARSGLIGAAPIERPEVVWIDGRVLAREDRPAEDRVRLTLAYRGGATEAARKVRVNVAPRDVGPEIVERARVRLRARLMPPGAPMVPGAYDFARTAWFAGLSATGSAIGPVTLIEPGRQGGSLAWAQRVLSGHVRERLDGSPGAIAAAFASGDRGGIAPADEEAMRDSGLTHLLSISGLHVSAVIAGVYVLAIRLLALWPWLALRVRLPLVAAASGAAAGIVYTLLTGAEVPTVRSCVGALLVLGALALGREPLSLRMVAAAAFVVMLAWPEAVVTPSFQMSFAAVIAIVSLHAAEPVKAFLAPREEGAPMRLARRTAMLLATGLVIEIALMPIVLFHFHRAGFYGALANVVAIPLVTFMTMPLIALALGLDVFGLGAPAWWLAGRSLELLLGIAHFTAERPGAIKLMPQMAGWVFAAFVGGSLWLALWRGRVRLWGLVPAAIASVALAATPVPDVLVSGDGRHVGIAGEGKRLLVLRESRSDFARDNLLEMAGMGGEPLVLNQWPGASCSRDFCSLVVERGGRQWRVLMARSRSRIEERALAAACDRADVVVADRWLPRSCRPRWLKADRQFLEENGGLALYLAEDRIATVAQTRRGHPWWDNRSRKAARAQVSCSGAANPRACPAP